MEIGDDDEVASPLEKVGTKVALTKFCIYSPAMKLQFISKGGKKEEGKEKRKTLLHDAPKKKMTSRECWEKKGKIDMLVSQLWFEGQVHPSSANIAPQLSFLSYTHPYADIILYSNMRFMQKVLFSLGSFPL